MTLHECQYCLKKFKSAKWLSNHECQQMKRYKMLHSPIGISAYNAYSLWMKRKGHRNRGEEQFIDSKTFTSFFNFIKFAAKMALPNQKKFIEYMIQLDIHPKDWTNKKVYEQYIKEFENLLTPEEQVETSVDTVYELSKIFECEPNEIFLHLEPVSLIRIVQAKKLSPWFLLNSNKFKWFINNEMTREQKLILEEYVNEYHWQGEFKNNVDTIKTIKSKIQELGL